MSRVGLLGRDVRCPCGSTLADMDDYPLHPAPYGFGGQTETHVSATCVSGHQVMISLVPTDGGGLRLVVESQPDGGAR